MDGVQNCDCVLIPFCSLRWGILHGRHGVVSNSGNDDDEDGDEGGADAARRLAGLRRRSLVSHDGGTASALCARNVSLLQILQFNTENWLVWMLGYLGASFVSSNKSSGIQNTSNDGIF